jgi:hypothetical protein
MVSGHQFQEPGRPEIMKKAVLALSAILLAVGTGAAYTPGEYQAVEIHEEFDSEDDYLDASNNPIPAWVRLDLSDVTLGTTDEINISATSSSDSLPGFNLSTRNYVPDKVRIEVNEVEKSLDVSVPMEDNYNISSEGTHEIDLWYSSTSDYMDSGEEFTFTTDVDGHRSLLIDEISLISEVNKTYAELWSEEKISLASSSTSKLFEASKINLFRINTTLEENESAEAVVTRYNDSEKIGEETLNITDGSNEFNLSTGEASTFKVEVTTTGDMEVHELLIDGKTTGYTPIISPTGGFFGGVTGFVGNIIGGISNFVGGVFSAVTGWIPFL